MDFELISDFAKAMNLIIQKRPEGLLFYMDKGDFVRRYTMSNGRDETLRILAFNWMSQSNGYNLRFIPAIQIHMQTTNKSFLEALMDVAIDAYKNQGES